MKAVGRPSPATLAMGHAGRLRGRPGALIRRGGGGRWRWPRTRRSRAASSSTSPPTPRPKFPPPPPPPQGPHLPPLLRPAPLLRGGGGGVLVARRMVGVSQRVCECECECVCVLCGRMWRWSRTRASTRRRGRSWASSTPPRPSTPPTPPSERRAAPPSQRRPARNRRAAAAGGWGGVRVPLAVAEGRDLVMAAALALVRARLRRGPACGWGQAAATAPYATHNETELSSDLFDATEDSRS